MPAINIQQQSEVNLQLMRTVNGSNLKLEEIKQLVTQGAQINCIDDYFFTQILLNGQFEIAEYLMVNNPDFVKVNSDKQKTNIEFIVKNGPEHLAYLYLEINSDSTDKQAMMFLSAAWNGKLSLADHLLKLGVDINTSNSSAIVKAAFNDHSQMVSRLIESGIDLVPNGNNALTHAMEMKDQTSFNLLLPHVTGSSVSYDQLNMMLVRGYYETIDATIKHGFDLSQEQYALIYDLVLLFIDKEDIPCDGDEIRQQQRLNTFYLAIDSFSQNEFTKFYDDFNLRRPRKPFSEEAIQIIESKRVAFTLDEIAENASVQSTSKNNVTPVLSNSL